MAISIKHDKPLKKTESVTHKQQELTVVSKVIKGDTYMVMADAAKELEDEFVNLYYTPGATNSHLAVLPPFLPKVLKGLVKQNNILNQCVQAMEVNIDGTGHEFVTDDPENKPDEEEVKQAEAFFSEPYPGKSFVSQRRLLRQDLESIGYGFLEVLRTMNGELAGLRYIEAQTIRLVRLGDSFDIPYTISRGGKDVDLTIKERPRRYMQTFNGTAKTYFKEYGTPMDLDKVTGNFSKIGEKLPAERRATELLAFGVDRDYSGPYFVPRWINQLPSVLGSRKAEEFNLEFFDSGGMPPAIIFIQGGSMVGETATQLRTYLSNQNKKKGRAVVVELASNSGSLESSGTVSARVERFGSERIGDGMFEKYDRVTEEHVRIGFRLPHIFIGRQENMNYATAVVAYQVAEAQVFQPERTEFDEIINRTLMKELGYKTIKFKSNPITLKNLEDLIKGLPLVKDIVEGPDFVDTFNNAMGTALTYKEPPAAPGTVDGQFDPNAGLPYDTTLPPGANPQAAQGAIQGDTTQQDATNPGDTAQKSEVSHIQLLKMVRRTAEAEGLVEPIMGLTEVQKSDVAAAVEALPASQRQVFDQLLQAYVTPHHGHSH
jgi:PBSX family phage portal protein